MPHPGGKLATDSPKSRHSGKENSDPDNKNSRQVHGIGKSFRQVESPRNLSSRNLSNHKSMHSFGSINESGLNTPPPSQSPTEMDMDRNSMLISPPPEDILRSAERRVVRIHTFTSW